MKKILYILYLTFFCISCRALADDYTYQSGYGVQCVWTEGNYVGIYTPAGSLIKNKCSSVDGNKALLSSGWSLTANKTYYCFAPYSDKYLLGSYSYSSLPISYKSQTQTANNSLSHLTAYDFMTAKGTTTASSADFSFDHLGSVVRILWTLPKAMNITSLTLSSQEEVFVTEANMNLTNSTFTPTTKSDDYTLTVSNVNLKKSESFVAYMMMLPTDLSGKILTLTLSGSDGTTLTAKAYGCEVLAGKTYTLCIAGGDFASITAQSSLRKSQRKTLAASSLASPSATLSDFPLDTENQFVQQIPGDVDNDRQVSLVDATTLVAYLLGRNPSNFNKGNADANNDTFITKADVETIVQLLLKNK